MDLGPQIPLNVLSKATRESRDTITQVASMINNSGMNRSQRRRLEKALKTTETITAHAQKHVNKKAYKEFQNILDVDMVHFFACLGITMYRSYHWTETEDNEHGQITSLFERVNKTMKDYAAKGIETPEIVNELDELTGIRLIPEEHRL